MDHHLKFAVVVLAIALVALAAGKVTQLYPVGMPKQAPAMHAHMLWTGDLNV